MIASTIIATALDDAIGAVETVEQFPWLVSREQLVQLVATAKRAVVFVGRKHEDALPKVAKAITALCELEDVLDEQEA